MKQVNRGQTWICRDRPGDGSVAILLHGWPYDIHAFLDIALVLAQAGFRVIVPYLRGYGTTRFRADAAPSNRWLRSISSQ